MKEKAKKSPKVRLELIARPLDVAGPDRKLCQECGLFNRKENKHPFLLPKVPESWDKSYVMVGSAPNHSEDRKGRLGVGEPYKLLKQLRKKAGISKDSVAFVDAVRCSTPYLKPPTSAQVRACRPFLLQVIDDLKPKNVILLGRTAITSARNRAGLSVIQARGKPIPIVGTKTKVVGYATYHPEAVEQGGVHLRDVILSDLKRKSRVKLDRPVLRAPSSTTILGFDSEYAPNKTLLTIGLASNNAAKAWDCSAISAENKVTIRRTKSLAGHNVAGDLDYLVQNKAAKNSWLRGDDLMDSLLLARLHDETKERGGYGLENLLCSEYTVPPWKEPTASQFKKNPDASLWDPHDRMERCRIDAWASVKLASLYHDDRTDLINISHRIEMTLYRVGLAGAAVLNSRFQRLGNEWQTASARYGDLVTRAAFKTGMTAFEPTNKNHLRELLFDRFHLKKMGYTKKSHEAQVDKEVLKETLKLTSKKRKRTIIKNILKFSSNDKLAKALYGGKHKEKSIGFLKIPFPGNKKLSLLHNWINPLGAKTGRRSGGGTDKEISHGGVNSQNWHPKARTLIVSRWYGEGGEIASFDYNKLEPLMMAWKIGSPALLAYFTTGGGYIQLGKDLLHLVVMNGSPEYKAIKAIYLGIGYYMNDWKLAHDLWFKAGLKFSEDWDEHVRKTVKVRKKYFKMFPEVKAYHRHQIREVTKYQRVVGELGMTRHLHHLGPDMEGFKRYLNQGINFPMQWLASLVTGSAMIDYERALLKEHKLSYIDWHEALLGNPYSLPCSPIINEIHDELLMDKHPKTGKRDMEILHEAMISVPTLRKMIPTFDVKLTVSTKVGRSWT